MKNHEKAWYLAQDILNWWDIDTIVNEWNKYCKNTGRELEIVHPMHMFNDIYKGISIRDFMIAYLKGLEDFDPKDYYFWEIDGDIFSSRHKDYICDKSHIDIKQLAEWFVEQEENSHVLFKKNTG